MITLDNSNHVVGTWQIKTDSILQSKTFNLFWDSPVIVRRPTRDMLEIKDIATNFKKW